MNMIKICKVSDLHTARLCADLGVDMIGLHLIHEVDNEKLDVYTAIVSRLRVECPSLTPVLVTKITDPAALGSILRITGLDWIQLHVPLDGAQARHLRKEIREHAGRQPGLIFVIAADDPDAEIRIGELKQIADYILLDSSYLGGTGEVADQQALGRYVHLANPIPVLIAGGINPENADVLLRATQAKGIDVQSGVQLDKYNKQKDPLLVTSLVARVRGVPQITLLRNVFAQSKSRTLVSLAVTAVKDNELDHVLARFRHTSIDLIHVDFSDRSIAPRFEAYPYGALVELHRSIPCIPYDIHLFTHNLAVQNGIIEQCMQNNPLLRLAILHIRDASDASAPVIDSFRDLCQRLDLAFGFALQATGFTSDSLQESLETIGRSHCDELSLITHSHTHSLQVVASHDLPLLQLLRSWSSNRDHPAWIGVDRDMSVEKLQVLADGHPNHVIVGQSLLTSSDPDDLIQRLRLLLKPIPGRQRG